MENNNDNLDLQTANFLTVLKNRELWNMLGFTQEQLRTIGQATKLNVLRSAEKIINDYQKEKEQAKANKEFDYYSESHPKLDPTGPKL